jgi:hypothetical protein
MKTSPSWIRLRISSSSESDFALRRDSCRQDPGSGATVAPPLECHSQGVSSAPGAAQLDGRSSAFRPPVHAPPSNPAPFTVAPPLGPAGTVGQDPGGPLGAGLEFLGLGALAPSRVSLARQPQKFRCSQTPPSMGGAPMWAWRICPRRSCGQKRSLTSPSTFWR